MIGSNTMSRLPNTNSAASGSGVSANESLLHKG